MSETKIIPEVQEERIDFESVVKRLPKKVRQALANSLVKDNGHVNIRKVQKFSHTLLGNKEILPPNSIGAKLDKDTIEKLGNESV